MPIHLHYIRQSKNESLDSPTSVKFVRQDSVRMRQAAGIAAPSTAIIENIVIKPANTPINHNNNNNNNNNSHNHKTQASLQTNNQSINEHSHGNNNNMNKTVTSPSL
ncbi:unnamed protein product [Cunninghamella blakesleeana]